MITIKQFNAQADETLSLLNDAKALNQERAVSIKQYAWNCLQLQIQGNIRDLVAIARSVAKGAKHAPLKQYVSRAKALAAMDVVTFTEGTGKKAKEVSFTKDQILGSNDPLFSVSTVYAAIRRQSETVKSEVTDDDIVSKQIAGTGREVSSLSDDEYDDLLNAGKLEIAEQEKAAMLENIPSMRKELEQKLALIRDAAPDTFAEIISEFSVPAKKGNTAQRQANAH